MRVCCLYGSVVYNRNRFCSGSLCVSSDITCRCHPSGSCLNVIMYFAGGSWVDDGVGHPEETVQLNWHLVIQFSMNTEWENAWAQVRVIQLPAGIMYQVSGIHNQVLGPGFESTVLSNPRYNMVDEDTAPLVLLHPPYVIIACAWYVL